MAKETVLPNGVKPFLRQLLAISGIVMYMIGTGANIAFPGVLCNQLRQNGSAIVLTEEHESWIASLLGLALIAGIAVAPFCLQRLGRKLTNQLSTLPALLGWAVLAAAKDPYTLLGSRVLQGFGMGMQAAAAPVSIAEYSAPRLRGAFLATIAFSFATGMLLAHIVGTLLYWRTGGLACGSVYVISLVLLSISPETPPYLASKGSFIKCRKAFRWLRGSNEESERELGALLNSQKNSSLEKPNPRPKSRLRVYLETVQKPEFYKPTVIMIFMFVLFQMSGMTVIPSYTVAITAEVTGGAIDSYNGMILIDVVRFLTAVIATALSNRFGRRSVLFFGIIVTVISLCLTSMLLYLRDYKILPEGWEWTPVVPTLFYIFGKTFGILPVPWAIAGEIFPLEYRSLGGGISGAILSIMFFVVVKTGPASFREIGIRGTFLVYALFVSICGGFLYFLLPETKGKTLYEIECHFKGLTNVTDKELNDRDRMLELQNVDGG